MAAAEVFANDPSTTVSAGGTTAPPGGTSEPWTVASSSSFPAAATGTSQFHVADPALPAELITVTNVSGTTWTVTRGAESTAPVAHAAGFTVQQVVSAGVLGEFPQAGHGDIGGTGAAPTVVSTHLASALPLAQGGTGQTAQQAAMDTLAGATTSGDYLRGTGSHVVMSAIQAADVPALNQNTTGTAAGLSTTLAISSGGTGSTARNFAGLLTPTGVKTSAYNAAAGDYVPCDTTSGTFTVTLPGAPADLTVAGVKQITQGSTNTVTIATSGSDVFNKASGATTLTLSLPNQGVLLQYSHAAGIWYVYADDLALSQLDSRYAYPQGVYNVRSAPYNATGNGVSDDTAACNAALLACHNGGGGTVLAPPGFTYLISASLVIYSNTRLLAYGATFTEAANSNCNMIQNAGVTPNRSVADAAITSATATLTSATAAFTSADAGATVAVTGANPAGQVLTANIVSVTNGTTVVLDTSAQNTVSGAACSIYYRDASIEIAGGTWNRNANGYTGGGTAGQNTTQLRFIDGLNVHDMSLSCTTVNGYQLSLAAVTNFVVRNITIYAPGTTANTDGVSVIGPAYRGLIDTVFGGDGDDFIAIHTNAGQGTVSAQACGNLADITITNIFPSGTGDAAVKINGSTGFTVQSITVRGVRGTYNSAVSFADQEPYFSDILFEDIDIVSPAAQFVNIIFIQSLNALGTLTFKNVALRSYASTNAINMFQVEAGSSIGTLVLENLTWEAGTSGNQSNLLQLLASSGSPTAINNIVVSKVTAQNTAAAWTYMVAAQQHSTIGTLTIRDVSVFTTQASDCPLFSVQGTVQAVIYDGIYLNGGGELADIGSTASAMQIIASNIVSYAAHRLFKINSAAETDIILTGVNINSLNQAGLINLGTTSPVITVRGSGFVNPSNVALFNGSTPATPARVVHQDMRADVATIAANLGDRAWNTNAASALLGPVVYDGTKWDPAYQVISTPVSIANGGTGQSARTAPAQFKPASPAATSSLNVLVMMGIGSTVTYTPTGSGTVLINLTGEGNIATGTAGIVIGCRYGTGTAPANGAAVTGTRFGGSADAGVRPAGTGSGAGAGVAFTDVLALTPATAYWFDLAVYTSNAADAASVVNISVTIIELP